MKCRKDSHFSVRKTIALGRQSEIERYFFSTLNGCGEKDEKLEDMSEGKRRVGVRVEERRIMVWAAVMLMRTENNSE